MNVAGAFARELQRMTTLPEGQILLQLGLCGKNPWLSGLPFKYRWILAPWETNQAQIVSSITNLPFDRNSLDCIVAPLTLEAFSSFSNPLDELDRVLKPMGHMVFWGINPFSLWGCWFRYSQSGCFGNTQQWSHSCLSLKQAMNQRGYRQIHLSCFYYIPPFREEKWLNRFEILNEIGKMLSPLPSAFYCLVMQKNQPCLIMPNALQMREAVA